MDRKMVIVPIPGLDFSGLAGPVLCRGDGHQSDPTTHIGVVARQCDAARTSTSCEACRYLVR